MICLFAVVETELVFWTYRQYVASKHWSAAKTDWRAACIPGRQSGNTHCTNQYKLVGFTVDGRQYVIKESPDLFGKEYSNDRRPGVTDVVLYNPKRPQEAVVKTHSHVAAALFGMQALAPFVLYGLWRGVVWLAVRRECQERQMKRISVDRVALKSAAQAVVRVVQGHADPATNKGTLYFAQSPQYCDSFISFARKKDGSLSSVDIGLTVRPASPTEPWLGYSAGIYRPQTRPDIADATEWYEDGNAKDIAGADLSAALKHIEQVCQTPLSTDNQVPPRESPKTMY